MCFEEPTKPVYMIDGAVLCAYPMWVFNEDTEFNKKTLGFKLITDDEIIPYKEINNIVDFSKTLIDCILTQMDKDQMKPEYEPNTVSIYCSNISSTDFEITDAEKSFLINQGYKATESFLNLN